MKKNVIVMGIGLFCGLGVSHHDVLAQEFARMQFPIQEPLMEENDLLAFISPFEMTSVSVGFLCPGYSRHGKDVLSSKGWFNRAPCSAIEIKLETPFYRARRASGFDCTVYYSGLLDNVKEKLAEDASESRKRLAGLVGADALGTYKWKWPFYTPLGVVAGTVTGKAGLICLGSVVDTVTKTTYGAGCGAVVSAALGCDYYFNQWVGGFFEISVKYNRVFFSKGSSPYSFYITDVKCGVKTTL